MIYKIKDNVGYEIKIDTETKEIDIHIELNTPKKVYCFNILCARNIKDMISDLDNPIITKNNLQEALNNIIRLLIKELEKENGTNS